MLVDYYDQNVVFVTVCI